MCVSLLIAVGIAGGASTRDRSERAVCMSNLRHIGRAFNMWASDHGDENPFIVNYADGGTRVGSITSPVMVVPGMQGVVYPFGLRNNVFIQFLWIHRELQTPQVLVCPSDQDSKRASEFSNASGRGFLDNQFQNNAVSYFIWLHALRELPNSILSGDRHIRYNGINSACGANVGNAIAINAAPDANLGWRNQIHGERGNYVRNDGSVEESSSQALRSVLLESYNENGAHHLLGVRP